MTARDALWIGSRYIPGSKAIPKRLSKIWRTI